MYSDDVQYAAVSRVDAGETPSSVADDLKIGKGTIVRWYAEYKDARLAGTLDKLYDSEKLLLAAAGQLTSQGGADADWIKKKASEMNAGLKGLAKLDEDTQLSALAINQKIKSLIMSSESPSELADLTDCLCALRTAFFAKGTQVNIQNVAGGSESKYRTLIRD